MPLASLQEQLAAQQQQLRRNSAGSSGLGSPAAAAVRAAQLAAKEAQLEQQQQELSQMQEAFTQVIGLIHLLSNATGSVAAVGALRSQALQEHASTEDDHEPVAGKCQKGLCSLVACWVDHDLCSVRLRSAPHRAMCVRAWTQSAPDCWVW